MLDGIISLNTATGVDKNLTFQGLSGKRIRRLVIQEGGIWMVMKEETISFAYIK